MGMNIFRNFITFVSLPLITGILFLQTPFCFSEMNTESTIIGFSEDGSFLAFEIRGYDRERERAFSLIQIVDTIKNDFVKDDFLKEVSGEGYHEKLQLESAQNRREALLWLMRTQIIDGNRGSLVFRNEDGDYCHNAEITVSYPEQESTYLIILTERETVADYCGYQSETELKPKIFTLTAESGNWTAALQEDSVLFRSRKCPYAYSISRVHVYKDKIAVFLDSYTHRGEESGVYKLVVTGVLDPVNRGLKDKERPEEGIWLDSGEIVLKMTADETTYEERTGYSHRKFSVWSYRGERKDEYSLILPEPRYSSLYPYRISSVYSDKERKYAVIEATTRVFAVFDLISYSISEWIEPVRAGDVLGVDGRSGNLVGMHSSDDGRILYFSAVHAGHYSYDLSDLRRPRRMSFQNDVSVNY